MSKVSFKPSNQDIKLFQAQVSLEQDMINNLDQFRTGENRSFSGIVV